MLRVMHFEVAADDPQRAADFYKNTFGWEIEEWKGDVSEYWLVTTGPDNERGINGGIFKRESPLSYSGGELIAYRCTVGVPSVDEYQEKVIKNGGTVTHPKMAVAGMGWLVYCKDTEGNVFGIMESDIGAK